MVINKQIKNKSLPLITVASLLFLALLPILMLSHASASGTFTTAYVRLDRLSAITATGGRVCAKPATALVEATVKVTFPITAATSYTLGAFANWTVNTTGLDTGQNAWLGIGTATNVTGNTVTFPSTDLVVGTLYCFNFTSVTTLTTSSAGAAETTQGNIATYTGAAALIDQTTISLSIISNDQVVVSGIVPPSFAFLLSGNTDSFTANLTPATVRSTTGQTITLTTTAATGWIVWAQDLNSSAGKGALNSVIAGNYKIAAINGAAPGTASSTLTTTNENYGLGVTINTDAAGGGTVALDAAYDGTGSKAGTLSPGTTAAPAYFPIASANGTANGDIININERANSIASTPAASDYTDTITFVGAGRF